uniref:Uncharacterized protein n=1 Tax=Anopheles atroparvus TaxID=41427 RepID=A0A182JF63_ANOAO
MTSSQPSSDAAAAGGQQTMMAENGTMLPSVVESVFNAARTGNLAALKFRVMRFKVAGAAAIHQNHMCTTTGRAGKMEPIRYLYLVVINLLLILGLMLSASVEDTVTIASSFSTGKK